MKRHLVAMLFMATSMAQGADGKIREVLDAEQLSPKEIASEVRRLSESKDSEERLLAADVISIFPAFLSGKTEVEVVTRLASDENAKVRYAALVAIEGLLKVALIRPFLPLVEKMQADQDQQVSQRAKKVYVLLTDSQKLFKKNGVTEEKARGHFFSNGLPEVY